MQALCTTFRTLLCTVAALAFAGSASASTVTYTDPLTGEPTNTVELPSDGHFAFRIGTLPKAPADIATASVGVTDDSGQMAPGCYPMGNDQTIAVTSELVIAAQPIVTVGAHAYSNADCTGSQSIMSNPITVEFVPGAPGLAGPLEQ